MSWVLRAVYEFQSRAEAEMAVDRLLTDRAVPVVWTLSEQGPDAQSPAAAAADAEG